MSLQRGACSVCVYVTVGRRRSRVRAFLPVRLQPLSPLSDDQSGGSAGRRRSACHPALLALAVRPRRAGGQGDEQSTDLPFRLVVGPIRDASPLPPSQTRRGSFRDARLIDFSQKVDAEAEVVVGGRTRMV